MLNKFLRCSGLTMMAVFVLADNALASADTDALAYSQTSRIPSAEDIIKSAEENVAKAKQDLDTATETFRTRKLRQEDEDYKVAEGLRSLVYTKGQEHTRAIQEMERIQQGIFYVITPDNKRVQLHIRNQHNEANSC